MKTFAQIIREGDGWSAGKWVVQKHPDFNIYMLLVSQLKNGGWSAITISDDRPVAAKKSIKNAYPTPSLIDEKDIPPKLKAKVEKKMNQLGIKLNEGDSSSGLGLDGMSKAKVKTLLHKTMKPFTTNKLWKDTAWNGPQAVWDSLNKLNVNWEQVKNEYYKDRDNPSGPNTGKRWEFKLSFDNDKGKYVKMGGIVTAAGAGSVEDPLDKYDLTFQIF